MQLGRWQVEFLAFLMQQKESEATTADFMRAKGVHPYGIDARSIYKATAALKRRRLIQRTRVNGSLVFLRLTDSGRRQLEARLARRAAAGER